MNSQEVREITIRTAELAKLKLPVENQEHFIEQFGKVLEYVEIINSVDLGEIEPLKHVHEVVNVFREDVVEPSLTAKEALSQAPKKNESFFKLF